MNRTLIILLLGLVGCSSQIQSQVIVTGSVQSVTGSLYDDKNITFEPLSTPYAFGGSVVTSGTRKASSTNRVFSVGLNWGGYLTTFSSGDKVVIWIPTNTPSPVAFTAITTNIPIPVLPTLSFAGITNYFVGTNYYTVTNIYYVTNNYGGSGTGFPLTSNANAGGYAITNLSYLQMSNFQANVVTVTGLMTASNVGNIFYGSQFNGGNFSGTYYGDGSHLTGVTAPPVAFTSNVKLVFGTNGAYGDCIQLQDASMTSGSANLHTRTPIFVAGDVGKVVEVIRAVNANTNLSTTISAFVNATNVTLADAATATVTNTQVYYGHDDTAAFQAGLDLGGLCFVPHGQYLIDGAYTAESTNSLSQLHLPVFSYSSPGAHSPYGFVGEAASIMTIANGTVVTNQSIIVSARTVPGLTDGVNGTLDRSGVIGAGGGYTGEYKFNYITLYLDTLLFRTYDNPANIPVNARWIGRVSFQNLFVDTGGFLTSIDPQHELFQSEPTWTASTGVVWPYKSNNTSLHGYNVSVDGYYWGQEITECGNLNSIAAWFCHGGFHVRANGHGINVFGSFAFGCTIKLYVEPTAGVFPINWAGFSGERQNAGFTNSPWTIAGDDISDPGTNLVGFLQNASGESLVINGVNTATDVLHTGLCISDASSVITTSAFRGRTSFDSLWIRPYALGWYVPDTNTIVFRNISNSLYKLTSISTNRFLTDADFLTSSDITQTNFVLNTVYSNYLSRPISIRGLVTITPASVIGVAEMDVMVDQTGGNTFTRIGGAKTSTLIGSLVMPNDLDFTVLLSVNANYYLTNSSTGIGNASSIVSGTGQLVPLSKP
jgi:hypothetical protein